MGAGSLTTVAVIPARYASSRFPGKPLAKDTGKFLIQHVYERVQESARVDRVLVATDDHRIADAVKSFGGEAQMTREGHENGTERVAEIVERLQLTDEDLVVNVQGDEPDVPPGALDRLIGSMSDEKRGCGIATLAAPFADDGPRSGPGSPLDPNCVKVVVDVGGRALYFSRSAIPYHRQGAGAVDRPSRWLLHLGVYAFRVDTLRLVTGGRLPHGTLDQTESLEQLRWLEHGVGISVVTIDRAFVGIDTLEDYAAFVGRMQGGSPELTRAGAGGTKP